MELKVDYKVLLNLVLVLILMVNPIFAGVGEEEPSGDIEDADDECGINIFCIGMEKAGKGIASGFLFVQDILLQATFGYANPLVDTDNDGTLDFLKFGVQVFDHLLVLIILIFGFYWLFLGFQFALTFFTDMTMDNVIENIFNYYKMLGWAIFSFGTTLVFLLMLKSLDGILNGAMFSAGTSIEDFSFMLLIIIMVFTIIDIFLLWQLFLPLLLSFLLVFLSPVILPIGLILSKVEGTTGLVGETIVTMFKAYALFPYIFALVGIFVQAVGISAGFSSNVDIQKQIDLLLILCIGALMSWLYVAFMPLFIGAKSLARMPRMFKSVFSKKGIMPGVARQFQNKFDINGKYQGQGSINKVLERLNNNITKSREKPFGGAVTGTKNAVVHAKENSSLFQHLSIKKNSFNVSRHVNKLKKWNENYKAFNSPQSFHMVAKAPNKKLSSKQVQDYVFKYV